jgi:hypothetical protein
MISGGNITVMVSNMDAGRGLIIGVALPHPNTRLPEPRAARS